MWNGKEIHLLTDDELWAAIHSVASVANFRFDKLKDPRLNEEIDGKKHRLNRIFSANPPVENETFTNLCNELNNEYKSRIKSK